MEDRVGAISGDARWYSDQPAAAPTPRPRRKRPAAPADAEPPAALDDDYFAPSEPDQDS
jgi:hypothetical protein